MSQDLDLDEISTDHKYAAKWAAAPPSTGKGSQRKLFQVRRKEMSAVLNVLNWRPQQNILVERVQLAGWTGFEVSKLIWYTPGQEI